MSALYGRKEFVARRLLEVGCVSFDAGEGYRLVIHEKHPPAPRSPFYIDLRLLRSIPRLLNDVAGLMVEEWGQLWSGVDLVSDVPVASTPIVTLISQKTGIPMISPRLAENTHGLATGGIIGLWQPGQRVAVIDDLRTTGGSKEQVIALYEGKGLKAVAVMALVDRGSPEGAEVAGQPFFSIYWWSLLLQFYRERRLISGELFQRSVRYPHELVLHVRSCHGCT